MKILGKEGDKGSSGDLKMGPWNQVTKGGEPIYQRRTDAKTGEKPVGGGKKKGLNQTVNKFRN